MTKRIIALLVAAIMAVSCCMLVACNKPEDPKTSEPKTSETSEPKTSETSEPKTSETSEPKTSETSEPSDEPSDPPVAGDGFYGSIDATEVMSDMYSTSTPWENWNGYFQFLPQLYKDEVDATENVNTEDYEWTWMVYAAPADENGGNVADEASFQSCQAQINTLYDWGTDDGKVIYRIQTGSLTKEWVIDHEYEVIVVVSKGDEKFKTQLFVVWTESSKMNMDAWVAGLTGDGTSGEKMKERHVPTTCAADFEFVEVVPAEE